MKFLYLLITLAIIASCAGNLPNDQDGLANLNFDRKDACLANPPMETLILPRAELFRVEGTVIYRSNALAGVTIFLENEQGGDEVLLEITGEDGRFGFDKIETGEFMLWTCKEGWNSLLMQIAIGSQYNHDLLVLELSLSQ